MASQFDKAFAMVQSLAKDFEANKAAYRSPSYQESEVRKDFIDKFLIALGWDVNHDQQKNPFEQEVKVERGVSMYGSQRRADYAFYVAPNFRDVRFYTEAKKPFGDIATADNYFQTIRYGWNSQTPIAILTNFEQFHILDCRYKPNIDAALAQYIRKFHYLEYPNKDCFGFIYYLFSRDAVANGSLEKFADTLPKLRGKAAQRGLFKGGYQSFDDAFLEELDEHRDTLARAFKNNNPKLDGETLTELTQRTIDRLVFMRFLEDKLIHPESLVSNFGDKGTAWQDFVSASRKLDAIYNGIVFKKHDILDTPNFKLDDNAFADICEKLAHVNSPYDFNSIPIYILGSIYERFLGKVIVTTDKRARIEEKPEVREAGGVKYTPEYISRYLTANTVGKLIEGKTPAQIAKMRFADLACGSGSILLAIFDLVLRYHVKWYNANPEQAKKAGCVLRDDGAWHLSLHQRREILLNNIYGNDIDHQAVEVAQLSLYLKLLQEETTASAHQHQLEFHETLLPSLSKNIVCGNSIVETDILSEQLFAGEEEKKLNPMDYEQRFHDVMKAGGFDAIVGNPPYVLVQILKQPFVFSYIKAKYRSAKYKIDTYHVFIERALSLTREGGMVGYITPNTFLRNKHAKELRNVILEQSEIQLLRLFYYNVFKGASVDTSVIILERVKNPSPKVHVSVVASDSPLEIVSLGTCAQSSWRADPEKQFSLPCKKGEEGLTAQITTASVLLGEFATAYFGIQTFDRTKYVAPEQRKGFKPVIDGQHIGRYTLSKGSEFVDFRPDAIKSGGKDAVYEQNRVGVRQIGKVPIATFLPAGLYTLNTIYNIVFTKPTTYSLYFILAIICSKCLQYYWCRKFFDQKETFPKIKKDALLSIPIPKIDFGTQTGKANHDRIVALVEQMLRAKQVLAGANSDADKDFYSNKCAAIDRQIDALVYELYGLTPEEIAIVEGTA